MLPLTWLMVVVMQGAECHADKDCVVLEAPCTGWELLPKGKVKAREKEVREMRANAPCAGANTVPKPEAMCVLTRCLVKPSKLPAADVETRCGTAEMHLRGLLDLQRTCKVDADCRLHDLKGRCPFGCVEALHKDADVKSLLRYLDAYGAACGACKNKCALLNQAYCETGTCKARFTAGARQP